MLTINNPFSLSGKTIFVSGASSGLGACIAEQSAVAGANTIITGRNAERLQATFDNISANGNTEACGDHQQIVCDLTATDAVQDLADSLPVVDGLVLCAGITKTLPVKFISSNAIQEIFQTNLFASMALIQRMLKLKKIKSGGSIVLISSISTTYADKGNSIYAASKGALSSFSRVLALELSAQKIRSNTIRPGFIPSRMLDAGAVSSEQLAAELKRYPLGFGDPTDIAYGALYLLSDASRWVTGSELTIDGGVTLR